MDEEYDVIVLGTGIKECILSALLAMNGKKVLNIDKNPYYGADTASLNLEDLMKKHAPEGVDKDKIEVPKTFGNYRHWCVDLCPKFMMSSGNLVKMLIYTDVTRYLEIVAVSGSYVSNSGKIHKVPATAGEALSSSLLGFFEKRRFKNFLEWVSKYDAAKPETWDKINASTLTAKQVFEQFSLSDDCVEFTGHCIALYQNDAYLKQSGLDLVAKCKLYATSLSRYGNSPFIYPRYGIGSIPEGFARLCAVSGGLQMLDKRVQGLAFDAAGKVEGVKVDDQVIKTKQVLADPTFMAGTEQANKVKKVCNIVRSICILKAPVANTGNAASAQIIIPAKQTGRKNDIYIALVSAEQAVCPDGFYVAVCSTVQEAAEADQESDLKPAFAYLGQILQKFTSVSEYFIPTDDGTADNVFVTASLDSTSHLELATNEVLALYPRMTGEDIDLAKKPANRNPDAVAQDEADTAGNPETA